MKHTVFEYKGYLGSAEVDIDGATLVGELLHIRDSIAYSADSVFELQNAFREAVDDYLAVCAEEGEAPDTPCKGSFNVRVGEDRHRNIAIAARRAGVGLNDYVCSALDVAIAGAMVVVHTHEHRNVLTSDPQQFTLLTGSSSNTDEAARGKRPH